MIKPLDRTGTWRTHTVDNGLPGMDIRHITDDSAGYLWFALRDNGAASYDGEEFLSFTTQDGLCSNWVHSMHKDRQDRLWFATRNGVCWYDGTSFHDLEADGISGRSVQSLYEDDRGRIWCGGIGTLGYDDGSEFHDQIPLYVQRYKQPPSPEWSNECRGITQDREGHLWFGFDHPVRFDHESFRRYDKEEGFPRAEIGYVVGRGHGGKVWIGRPRSQAATRARRAYYRDLPAGDYTFQVRAVDRDLNYSRIAQAELSIQPDPRIEALTFALNSQENREFIGQSAAMRQFHAELRQVAEYQVL